MTPTALTIAGSDPSGGAGLQADIKTFQQHGVYGMSVVTLITVQNTESVDAVVVLDPDLILKQLQAVISDIPPLAAKTGALGSPEIVDAISMRASNFDFPLIVDPVMLSKHKAALLSPEAVNVLRKQLLPFAYLITPNIHEAEILSELNVEDVNAMERAAVSIAKLGPKHVLIKGGHLEGEATDVLYFEKQIYRFPTPKIHTQHTHGTGCVYSAAITSQLARRTGLLKAVKNSKEFITQAIRTAPELGRGHGPLNINVPVSFK